MSLPNGYIQVEYVENIANNVIKLPIISSGNYSWYLVCQYIGQYAAVKPIIGHYGGSSSFSWYIGDGFGSSNTNYGVQNRNRYGEIETCNSGFDRNVKVILMGTSGASYITVYSYDSYPYDYTDCNIDILDLSYDTYLFDDEAHSGNATANARIFRFYVVDNTTNKLLYDLVPVICTNLGDDYEMIPGLYDTINGNFYYDSASTSNLVPGPIKVDVNIKYDVYMGNTKFDIKMNDEMFIPYSDCATREEVEVYFRQMTTPTLSVSGNVATLTFTAIPEYIAKGMLKHKMVQFRVVRNKADQTTHRRFSYGRSYSAKNWVKETFQSGSNDSTFTYDNNKVNIGPYNADITILNTPIEQANSVITLSELTSGTIQRTCKWNYKFGGGTNNYTRSVVTAAIFKGDGYVYNQFKVGLVYYNKNSVPTLFRVANYDYHG